MTKRIGTLIGTFAQAIDAADAEYAHYIGLSLTGLRVLDQLFQTNGQKASDLARAVGILPTGFTFPLDKLEKSGFVCRQADPKDRRAILVYLTPAGESLRKTVIGYMETAEARLRAEVLSRLNQSKSPGSLEKLFAPLPAVNPF